MAAFHRESRQDPTVVFLEWCGTYLMPQGTTPENIADAGGDVVAYELMRARKERALHGERHHVPAEVTDGWEDCDDSAWDSLLRAADRR
jgi:hypothetical protein